MKKEDNLIELKNKVKKGLNNPIEDELGNYAYAFCSWTDNVDLFYGQLKETTKKDYTEYQPWLKFKDRNFFNNIRNEFRNNSQFILDCSKACDKVVSIFDEKALNDLKNYYQKKNIYKDADTLFEEYNSTKLDKLIHNKKYSDEIQINFILKIDSIFMRDGVMPEVLRLYENSHTEMER